MYLVDGSIHEGQYAEGKRHGKGRLVKPNGDIFVGVFQSDMMIKGIYTWKSGERYEGDFKNGVPHGKGKFISRDGKVTQGEFANGVHVSS